jgi:hypothetical protein
MDKFSITFGKIRKGDIKVNKNIIISHEFKDLFTNLLPQEVLQIGQTYNAIAEINL